MMDVADPKTFWLTVTNIALGLLVALCFLAIAVGSLLEVVSKVKKRGSYITELDHDMRHMFGPPHPDMVAPCTTGPAVGSAPMPKSRTGFLRRLRSVGNGKRRPRP